MITVENLTKRYGSTVAVNDLSFEVKPGVVTGFLGPNGSGKSTTMRAILGLDNPTSGRVSINGTTYRHINAPLHEIGALLDAKALNPTRSARNHLRALAAANNIPYSRVDEVLEFVGLAAVAKKRAGSFSLGMSQRLGIAAALLGDPQILLFDEPVNGLDPEGIRWIREFFRTLANEGRTVFVSSHLMSEMALTADQIIVIGRGHLITTGSVSDLTASVAGSVLVRSADNARLGEALRGAGARVEDGTSDALVVNDLDATRVGEIALSAGVALSELSPQRASLEEVFMELTADSVEYGHQEERS
ncbi:MAG: ABC transporter ATP-binding protein [Acidimicrobiaceae bacterium]|nr:ABC transporter ATP-binding protein [Acidimicrobiaceae bacterium]